MAMRILPILLGAIVGLSAYADSESNWSGRWTPYAWEGVCRISEWYSVSGLEPYHSYYSRFESLIYWPESFEKDSIWDIANREGITPGEIFFVIDGPGTKDKIRGQIENYPVSISIAGLPAKKIELPPEPEGHFEHFSFILQEPDSTNILNMIAQEKLVRFELLLADDTRHSFTLTNKDVSLFNVSLAQFKACIEVMPSNKSLKADALKRAA